MDRHVQDLEDWLQSARTRLEAGTLAATDLDQFQALLRRPTRQRLLYLRTADPTPYSAVVAMSSCEPIASHRQQLATEPIEWPYQTVHAALCAGWQVIRFPQIEAPFDDREIDILGYEFVLQKLETYHD